MNKELECVLIAWGITEAYCKRHCWLWC